MASMNITEDDFQAIAGAANFALEHGRMEDALRLDKIARKANAGLANKDLAKHRKLGFGTPRGMRWTDVPSTLMSPNA